MSRSAGGLGQLVTEFDMISPLIPGSYSLTRKAVLNNRTVGPIVVTYAPNANCTNAAIRDLGDDAWFHDQGPSSRPVIGDFDNDGFEDDILYRGWCGTSTQECWRVHFANKTSMTTTEFGGRSMWFYSETAVGSPMTGDFDGDGFRDDVAYFGRCGVGFICLRAHMGNKTQFSQVRQLGWDIWSYDETPDSAPMVGDFDNDGHKDDIIYHGRCGGGGGCWRVHIVN